MDYTLAVVTGGVGFIVGLCTRVFAEAIKLHVKDRHQHDKYSSGLASTQSKMPDIFTQFRKILAANEFNRTFTVDHVSSLDVVDYSEEEKLQIIFVDRMKPLIGKINYLRAHGYIGANKSCDTGPVLNYYFTEAFASWLIETTPKKKPKNLAI